MATHSSILAWKIPWTEEPGRLQSMGSLRVRHDWTTSLWLFTLTFHFHALEKEMATHSSVLAWRILGTGKPGGLPSMGLHRVRHDWSDLAAKSCEYLVLKVWTGRRVLAMPSLFFILRHLAGKHKFWILTKQSLQSHSGILQVLLMSPVAVIPKV